MSTRITQKQQQPGNTEDWLTSLLLELAQCQQRRLISCQGSPAWGQQFIQLVRSRADRQILLSNQSSDGNAVPFSKAETLLGQEAKIVIVDLFQGLNADVLCIAAGLVEAGGLLVLLSPEPQQWGQIDDEYAIWQNQQVSPKLRFIEYFFDMIRRDTTVCIELPERRDLPAIQPLPVATKTALVDGKTSDQLDVLGEIDAWLRHPQKRIALITAHRGRGKSTCLGFIVRKLVEEKGLSVTVTACSKQSAAMLLAHYDSAKFIAPDQLIEQSLTADVLIIDEAAMLPQAMLDQLCRQFERVVMATTTGGYEGTGQGFLLRFVARLPEHRLCWLRLHQPVRWGNSDCLENWIDDVFMLDTVVTPGAIELSDIQNRILDRDLDQHRLTEIYRLMADAHYRTRPSDLRALMESPDLIPVVAESQAVFAGVALVNREGGLDPDLSKQIFLGQRRPKGHLLAQMLTAQAGLVDFATYQGLRIQRIAVLEAERRRGLGRGLIQTLEDYAAAEGLDYVGASFAFDNESAGFWQSCGFQLVHLGYGYGKSSGKHSVAVIKCLNPALESAVIRLQAKLHASLPLWLCQFLQRMSVDNVVSLLRFSGFRAELSNIERDELFAFTQGHKGFELCLVSLQRAVMSAIARTGCDQSIHPWLVEKAVQNRDWDCLSADPDCTGRKSRQNRLRGLVGELLEREI